MTLVGSQGQLPPGEVLATARIDPATVSVLDGRIPNWRVVVADLPGVLKRDWHLDEADIAWEHTFLSRLAMTGFPAPRPIPAFAGRSWLRLGGALWTLVRYQPGHVLGWAERPGLGEVGRFIAHYHEAVDGLEMDAPRPLVPMIDDLAACAPWDQLARSLHGDDGVRQFAAHLEQTATELVTVGHSRAPRLLIHGDFTTDNILINGQPPAIVGAIDFALTNREPALADLAFSLWRSGRPEPGAMALDPQRVTALVAGYASRGGLPARTAHALPAYVKARGLQLIVRATRAGSVDCTPILERLGHLAAQQERLQMALTEVLGSA